MSTILNRYQLIAIMMIIISGMSVMAAPSNELELEIERAPRIDALAPTENGAISGCCNSCNNPDLSGKVLQELKRCCDKIDIDFQGTFTVLASFTSSFSAIIDAISSLTGCCAGTFTALEDIRSTLTACCDLIEHNFESTFTVLEDIRSTLTACCQEIRDDFTGVFTVLIDIKGTLTSCCASIENNFDGTFTVLEDIRTTLTTCCQDLLGIFTVLCPCGSAIPVTGPIIITVPGLYCLTNNVNGPIVIAADDVELDMNKKEISNVGGVALFIQGQRNISVNNGSLVNSAIGMLIQTSTQIILENVTFQANTLTAMEQELSADIIVNNCLFMNNTGTIVDLSETQNSIFNNCIIDSNNMTFGLTVFFSRGFSLNDCIISNNVVTVDNNIVFMNVCFDSIIQRCHIYNNEILAMSDCTIVRADFSSKLHMIEDIIEDNFVFASPSTLSVIQVQGVGDNIRGCTISRNNATGPGTSNGILFQNTENGGVIEQNIVSFNETAVGVFNGITDLTAFTFNSIIISNQVNVVPPAASYVIAGGAIPIVTLSKSTATLTPTPAPTTNLHNLAMVP